MHKKERDENINKIVKKVEIFGFFDMSFFNVLLKSPISLGIKNNDSNIIIFSK
ncbi:hypothetical protein [Moraxella lacunata]|uniref:hypothetical protein n=1 Tax=Moraxella lacunata TaxID=477 RepID=UPI003EE33E8F